VDLAGQVIKGGAPGLHLYAFNQHESVLEVLDGCGLLTAPVPAPTELPTRV
jgi:methylenetetrahydrofolate reductase (NADPH)